MIWMFHELLEPCLRDSDAFILRVIILDLESLVHGLLDDVFHVLLAQCAEDPEEEITLWKVTGQLFSGRQVLGEHTILHGIIIEVLHRELLIGRYLKPDDLILLEMELFFGEDVPEEAELCALHGRKEDIHCMRMS
jgi:hypothetical protein